MMSRLSSRKRVDICSHVGEYSDFKII